MRVAFTYLILIYIYHIYILRQSCTQLCTPCASYLFGCWREGVGHPVAAKGYIVLRKKHGLAGFSGGLGTNILFFWIGGEPALKKKKICLMKGEGAEGSQGGSINHSGSPSIFHKPPSHTSPPPPPLLPPPLKTSSSLLPKFPS